MWIFPDICRRIFPAVTPGPDQPNVFAEPDSSSHAEFIPFPESKRTMCKTPKKLRQQASLSNLLPPRRRGHCPSSRYANKLPTNSARRQLVSFFFFVSSPKWLFTFRYPVSFNLNKFDASLNTGGEIVSHLFRPGWNDPSTLAVWLCSVGGERRFLDIALTSLRLMYQHGWSPILKRFTLKREPRGRKLLS